MAWDINKITDFGPLFISIFFNILYFFSFGALAAIILYVTQFFVAGYSISWIAAIIGALIYGVVDYFIPGKQQM